MAADAALLAGAETAVIRFYGWDPPALSIGRFQSMDDAPELPPGADRIQRVTGGGAIYHFRELTFGLVLPTAQHPWAANPLRLYAFTNSCWITALERLGVAVTERRDAEDSGPFLCFDRRERTDLVVGDRKILGSAQRRTADRVLIHGSLPLFPNPLSRGAISVAEAAGRDIDSDEVIDVFLDVISL